MDDITLPEKALFGSEFACDVTIHFGDTNLTTSVNCTITNTYFRVS